MSEAPARVDAAVSDRRPVPRGVLPRGMQTWLMVAVAVGMVAIILVAGRPEPPARAPSVAVATPVTANADRVRDYQDRLRVLEARTVQEAQAQAITAPQRPALSDDPPVVASQDPLVAERKRREYESLFASNVVLSRRPQGQRPDASQSTTIRGAQAPSLSDAAIPSIDEIADAAVRATSRANGAVAQSPAPPAAILPNSGAAIGQGRSGPARPARTDPITDAGPLHRILEGTIIDAV